MKCEMPSETSVKKEGNLMVGIDPEKEEVTCACGALCVRHKGTRAGCHVQAVADRGASRRPHMHLQVPGEVIEHELDDGDERRRE